MAVGIRRGPRTALVAESDRAMRDMLRVHLENAGFRVILAPDAMVAGRTLLQSPREVDVLVVDVQLPYMTGIDFVSALVADSSLPFIPTVLIARNEDLARRADALDVPILMAPFAAQELLASVEAAIAKTWGKPTPGDGTNSMKKWLEELTLPTEPFKPGLRIIVADDEPDTVTSLTAILCQEGHSVFGSHHGSEVLPEVRINKPDAVILDIDMPGISGYAIARDIRELFEDAPLLIAVSGKWVGKTDRMLAKLAGFDFFFQKPCHPDKLLELLRCGKRVDDAADTIPCEISPIFQS